MDFIALPKIELHAHLSGSISRECLHEIWVRQMERGETSLADPLIEMPISKVDYNIDTFFPLFGSYIYNLCNDVASLKYTTNSVLEDFQADGVVYLELRTTPRPLTSANISKDVYVQTILSCISTFQASNTMRANLILSIDRRNDLATALEVVALANKHQGAGVVGIDLCGDPAVGDISIFEPAFRKAKALGLKITIHFAEAPHSSTPKELWKLLDYEPDRIGHVINVPDDVKAEIVRRKLGLELCLSCNCQAKMIEGTYADHHFGFWRSQGCPIAMSTDDVGVFRSKLSNEYALVAEHFALSRDDVCALARSAISATFADESTKQWLRRVMLYA